ncbi:hypothetical protein BS47DRAFT_1139570 [Hydnum rufescens UP504]|uniref:Uncharacterized protein n=1 Tax=Hydnum rufescens UP504 TaxID=1448309 RepID=A0A9P6DR31_9AGAM|nr:hypothetical protein BS47DRAFT_1139570 [Hydnum rufescens UP504]
MSFKCLDRRDSRLSHGIDHGNLSDRSLFPSSFRFAGDSSYLTIHWCAHGGNSYEWVRAKFHVPLSSLRRSALHGDALAIPWEAWSNGVYFDNDAKMDYRMSGGRLIYFTHSVDLDSRCHVSLFDLNRSRTGRLGGTSADPCTDHAPLHVIKSDLLRGEIRMEHPHPVHLASRSFSLDGSIFPPGMVCDEEHMVFWALQCPVVTTGEEAEEEDEDVPYVNKLIILTML